MRHLLPVPVVVTLGTAATTVAGQNLEAPPGGATPWVAVVVAATTVVACAVLGRRLVSTWLRTIEHPVHQRPLATVVVVALAAAAVVALVVRPSDGAWFAVWLVAMATPALWTVALDGTRPGRLLLRVLAGLAALPVGYAAAAVIGWVTIATADVVATNVGDVGALASVAGAVGGVLLLLAWTLATTVGFAVTHAAVLAVPPSGGYGTPGASAPARPGPGTEPLAVTRAAGG